MKKIYLVIAHLSNGDVLISPNRTSYLFDFKGEDKAVILPGFQTIEDAQAAVEAHKANFPDVELEIVPRWWGFDLSREEILCKAENGRWCPVTVEKLKDAIRKKLDTTTEDSDCIEFLCKNKLCCIYIDEEGYHFQVQDLNGDIKEKALPINPDWFILYSFKPTLSWTFSQDAAKIFIELLKK